MSLDDVLVKFIPKLIQASQANDAHRSQLIARQFLGAVSTIDRKLGKRLSSEVADRVKGQGAGVLRSNANRAPVDSGSNLDLIRHCDTTSITKPIFPENIEKAIQSFCSEFRLSDKLLSVGLSPRSKLLLVGPPGVGKTTLASAIAAELDLPMFSVEIAAAISSFLGKSGRNLSEVFRHSRRTPCVLVIDEFDSIAKSRQDVHDLGELKRLVNILLVELDRWNSQSVLIATTNNEEMLDDAVFRRFDQILRIENPDAMTAKLILLNHMAPLEPSTEVVNLFSCIFHNLPGSSIEHFSQGVRRNVALSNATVDEAFLTELASKLQSKQQKQEFCHLLIAKTPRKFWKTQRRIAEMLGVTPATVSKYLKESKKGLNK